MIFRLRHSLADSPPCPAESDSLSLTTTLRAGSTDCPFASSCSPPHFAMTQLLIATTLWLTPTGTFTLLISCPCGRTNDKLRLSHRLQTPYRVRASYELAQLIALRAISIIRGLLRSTPGCKSDIDRKAPQTYRRRPRKAGRQ